MKDIAQPFEIFCADVAPLAVKRGPLLCQLPPSLAFDAAVLDTAFRAIRNIDDGQIVLEARHKSWASAEAVDFLKSYAIDRVLADPSPVWPAEIFVLLRVICVCTENRRSTIRVTRTRR
ncbi:hypothetical protein AGR4C_pb30056 [Agrobacterium tumefaciens str. Kerr 14]|uniref:Uncharacterized protein n=1 Tax=Agrobacterium tumefaciens str. Kerr 14 TaxID=1183424 RepID=A0A1S7SEY3_AGRTU|nr:hypothetical protein AGR4C_pb30056 [Agrobacterium tumefaciens str. Kerr 14]